MQYSIQIADISILADVPYFIHMSESMAEFISPASEAIEADLRMIIHPAKELPVMNDVRHTEPDRVFIGQGDEEGTFFCSYPGNSPYAFVSRHTVKDGYLTCKYLPGNEVYMNYTRNLVTLMDIEATLLHFNSIILHASLIRWERMGVIFTAPSGTGKSTQADLWKRYEGAEVLNGDRAALRQIDSEWQAFGLPYAGTSGIYRNESAPLKAIVALRQAKENRIRKINGAEAFKYLYPETMIHRWDMAFEQKASSLLITLMAEVPVYLLECRPDRRAVDLLRGILETTRDK